ncbi:MAG: hypothetical protein MMC33_003158 [Icmadophila ericetorum]|nr:hypothetical protein [Icmadophila ericetorum]
MLPDFLASSYERYKQDTALFTTWLTQAAARCGFKSNDIKQQERDVTLNSNPGPSMSVVSNAGEPSSSRLKGKDRKLAKQAAVDGKIKGPANFEESLPSSTIGQYTVTTKDLLSQARAVAECVKPRVTLPASLQSIVERAIHARQRCTEWFRKSNIRNRYADESDKRHLHFTGVLEESLKLLGPCLETPTSSSQQPTKPGCSLDIDAPMSISKLANRFEILEVEELPDIDAFASSPSANTTKRAKKSKSKSVVDVYELEDDMDDDDIAFMIFCFFEDLHRIQDYIGEIWKSYRAGETNLQTAAITTNVALDLVRQAEAKILDTAPKLFNKKRSWDTIAIIIFYADAFEQGVCPEARLGTTETLRITPFDNFIYLSTARVLMKFIWISEIPGEAKPGYPLPGFPLRAGYVARPELLGTPEMDRKEEEDKILTQFIIDHDLWCDLKVNISKIKRPAQDAPMEDEFSNGLEKLKSDGILSVALVFAAQIYLDIQNIMGQEVGNGHRDLQSMTKEIDEIMNLKNVGGAWDVGGSGERWHEKDVAVVMRIKQTSLDWILHNPLPQLKEYTIAKTPVGELDPIDEPAVPGPLKMDIPNIVTPGSSKPTISGVHLPQGSEKLGAAREKPTPPTDPKFSTISVYLHKIPRNFKGTKEDRDRLITQNLVAQGHLPDAEGPTKEHEENAKRLNIKAIQPSKDMNFLFTSNPIYCGLVAFNLLTDYETAGIALCNWHSTIWYMAHLYNALRQMSVVRQTWPEMEGFFELHKHDLFAEKLPLTPNEFFARFALSVGVSATMFARNRNGSSLKLKKGHTGTQLRASPTSDIFHQYFDKKDSFETFLVRMEALLQESGCRKTPREIATQRRLTSLQFLHKLKDHSVRAVQLMRLYVRIRLELGITHPVQHTEDSSDQYSAIMVYMILEEVKKAGSSPQNVRGRPLHSATSPQLVVAGETLSKFLATHNAQDLISNFNGLPRTSCAPSGMVPNHWNISIRHVSLHPPGDLVFMVNPEAHYIHTEGPIQTVEGQLPGHKLNPKSLVTLQVIARLIMKAFVEGCGAGTAMARRPWSWSTNDADFARRITKVMKDMGVQEEALLSMSVADAKENESVDEDWENLQLEMMQLLRR